MKKVSDAVVSRYMSDYLSGADNDLVTQMTGIGIVNAVFEGREIKRKFYI